MTTVLVGAKQARYSVNRQKLCDASPFFRERLEDDVQTKPVSLWLPSESSTMFAIFVEWVHSPATFRRFLDHAATAAEETSERTAQDLHWAIVRLHLFASHLDLYRLQDLVMDAIQDQYLRSDWDVPPSLIVYLYTQCEALPAVRVRRWAVAMVAFSLAVDSEQPLKFHPQDSATSDPARFRALFDSLPEFASDYTTHVRNMKAAGLDLRFKNPQLRISANKLRNDQRLFGFRECSFHSHRAAVGESRCPYIEVGGRSKPASELEKRGMHKMSKLLEPTLAMSPATTSMGHHDAMPKPLFSRNTRRESQHQRALKHARPASTT